MITFPNAKINLGLNIVERRPDGYHNLETVFYPIPLTDVLEIVPADELSLTCYGNTVDCPTEKNLVMKAYRLMQQRYDLPPVAMHLYKHIPDGAGLGGGSSDAAHALLMLNTMFDLHVAVDELAAMASSLGADCAFFVHNRPMIATGIGDVLSPVDVDLSGKWLLLAKPPVGVDTRTAYSRVMPQTPAVPLANIITLILGVTIASQMQAEQFLQMDTLMILGLGLFAFIFDTAGGVLFAKFLNLFLKKKINPMIGAAGISAFPMSGRVVHKLALKEDPTNFLLMQATGVNVSGQIASVIAGGLILNFFLH